MEVITLTTKGNVAGLTALLERNKDIDVNFVDPDDGRTALHIAASAGDIQCLRILLQQPAVNVDAQDVQGNTPLHLAAARSEPGAVKLLIDAGASMSSKNIRGNRPIDYAKDRDIETLLVERMSLRRTSPSISDRSVSLNKATSQQAEWESEIPYDVETLRPFCIDVIISHSIFQERCKETIRQLIEEKHIALHKNRLLEQAAGIHDRETSERFIDQLQYWQDENERQASTIAYLKVRVQMLEHAAMQQEEYYRNNLADLMKQHQEQLRAVFKRNEETEKAFLTYQKSHSDEVAELSRLRTEVAYLTKEKPLAKGEAYVDSTELQALRKELADVKAQNVQIESRLKLAEKLKTMTEKENADLRKEMDDARKTQRDEMIKSLHEARDERDEKDESTGNILFVKGDGTQKRIKGATPQKLVERLTDPTVYGVNGSDAAILLTHKTFMDSGQLIEAIMKRYENSAAAGGGEGGGGQTPLLIRSRIVNTLKSWIENFWSDFAEDAVLLDKLTSFADAIQEENLATVMKAIITRKLNGSDNMVLPKSLAAPPKPLLPKVLIKRYSREPRVMSMHLGAADRPASLQIGPGMPWGAGKKGGEGDDVKLKLVDLEPVEIARQMTLLEFDLFKAVKPREFLGLAWMKDDKETRAPNITRMTRWSNHVIHWVISEVVCVRESTKARAAVFEKFILVAQHLERMNNYNGVKEVLAALQSSSLYRLKRTKEAVGSKYMKAYEELTKMTSSDLNYKNLRAKVHAAEPPVIPFPGVYQGDLVFLDTCSKDTLEGGLINYQKLQKITSYIVELQTYQQTHYSLESITEIQDYIRHFQVLTDDQAYKYSLVCEPRQ
ncbi:hypothetical protein HDV00_003997 [Rhizophlyctis rosea]|nr:hypothetical protein HDV00_003997 [Rhizophlyctis rosea]